MLYWSIIYEFDCIPLTNLITFLNIESYITYKFCNFTTNETNIIKYIQKCHTKCLSECNEQIYDIFFKYYSGQIMKFIPHSNKFLTVISNPSLTFIQYLISMGGLLSLWNGLSYVDIIKLSKFIYKKIDGIIFKYFYKFHTYLYIIFQFILCIVTKYSIPYSKVSITKLVVSFKVLFILNFL